MPYVGRAHLANFNSIKVQLKPRQAAQSPQGTSIFQFHKGTIKTSKGF